VTGPKELEAHVQVEQEIDLQVQQTAVHGVGLRGLLGVACGAGAPLRGAVAARAFGLTAPRAVAPGVGSRLGGRAGGGVGPLVGLGGFAGGLRGRVPRVVGAGFARVVRLLGVPGLPRPLVVAAGTVRCGLWLVGGVRGRLRRRLTCGASLIATSWA
jgi:hypothetical protein